MRSLSASLRSSSSHDGISWACLELSPISFPFPLSFESLVFITFCTACFFLRIRLQPTSLLLFCLWFLLSLGMKGYWLFSVSLAARWVSCDIHIGGMDSDISECLR
ncbi:hypothetical protein HanXRQr2_Chr17g0826271 [Helianthus annuus]|uniref:Uncharacterized protein n=1 Tax=Helianthus annuus TaxID=4232 RepID=A0A9K3DKW2_HELAN|nr:hypothetical protein HanXRQr2_Chr17g0826271 [Helianthus annuus]